MRSFGPCGVGTNAFQSLGGNVEIGNGKMSECTWYEWVKVEHVPVGEFIKEQAKGNMQLVDGIIYKKIRHDDDEYGK